MTTTRSSPTPATAAAEVPDGAPKLQPGTVISGRYRVVSLLGEGAMGAVYRVEHVHIRKPLALKVLHPRLSNLPEAVARFEREAIAAGNIGHANVAAATDFGKLADGSFFLILEFVAGRSLRTEADAGRLEPRRVLRIMRGVLAGVAAAHAKGIVHRDLKPENIMLVEREDDPDFVKVLDFGIAKLKPAGSAEAGPQPLTQVGTVVGTPDYMSPEQALGHAVDGRSDLYSLGIVLFELMTGDRPFRGGSATLLRQQVMDEPPPIAREVLAAWDPRIAGIVRTLLAKAPEQRFQTAPELMAALDDVARAMSKSGGAFAATIVAPAPVIAEARSPRSIASSVLGWRTALGFAVAIASVALFFALCDSSNDVAPPPGPATSAPIRTAAPNAVGPSDPALPSTGAPSTGGAPAVSSPRGSSRSSTPAPKASSARKTGPGGIYIPPPRDWFK